MFAPEESTALTLLNVGFVSPGGWYLIILSTLTFAAQLLPVDVDTPVVATERVSVRLNPLGTLGSKTTSPIKCALYSLLIDGESWITDLTSSIL